MVLTAYLALTYDGLGIHSIHNIAKAESVNHLSKSDNKRLAEYMLNRVEYGLEGNALSVESRSSHRYLSKLHKDYEHDLKSNYFEPNEINEFEAIEMIYKDQLEDELDKIAPRIEVTIGAGK